MAQEGKVVGIVALVEGQVFARAADGTQRQLKVGDPVFEGDVLLTGADSRVELTFDNGNKFLLREKESVTLDSAVIGGELPDARDVALLGRVSESTDIARAIAEGSSLDQLLEETAANLGGGAGTDGHGFVQLLRIVEALAPPDYQFGSSGLGRLDQLQPGDRGDFVGGPAAGATVTLNVGAVDDLPVAVNDTVAATEDTPVTAS
ncbi:MAG: retention module-containing protein, partial [Gammaproteobacteria bacterium]|nr:retention module-containing protein [Gammaproteobacteria bacterium]MBU1973514.1 retention module-containing protein [Gammaproteobacteria bacterium]